MHRLRRRPLIVAVTAGVMAAVVLLAASGPAAAGGSAPNGAPGAAPASCTLQPAAHQSDRHEFAGCLRVHVELGHAPMVGETVALRLEVRSEIQADRLRVEVDLPSKLAWVRVPAGLRQQATVTSRAPHHDGALHRASGVRSVAAGQAIRFDGTVRATTSGPAEIQARVTVARPWGADGAQDSVLLTIGDARTANTLMISDVDRGAVATSGPTAGPAAPHLAYRPVGTAGLPTPHSDDTPAKGGARTAAVACVQGGWAYTDQDGVSRASRNYQVQAWDHDSVGANDLLAVSVTATDGTYNLCFDNDDGFLGGGQDVYLVFVSEVTLWKVQKPDGQPYKHQSTQVNNVADGSTTGFGWLGPNGLDRAVHAFDEANDAWLWKPGYCWDHFDVVCRQLKINWAPGSTDGTYYSTETKDVHLAAADPDSQILVVHEIGHALMDDVYEDAYPDTPNCNPHSVRQASSAGCAWSEGFAEWFPASVYRDPAFRWPGGAFVDLESPSWRAADWDDGDTVEGRVASALIDLSDGTNERYWDRHTEGAPGATWEIFLRNNSTTMSHYWQQRAAQWYGIDDWGPNASLYQCTIDYTFRDPMFDGMDLWRPVPLPQPHNYRISTSPSRWQVIGLRSPAGADYDLQLYDDLAQTNLLSASIAGPDTIDFIAIDTTWRPSGEDFPRVRRAGGDGEYHIEYIEERAGGAGPVFFMGGDDLVQVFSFYTDGPAGFRFTVRPSDPSQDLELFLMVGSGASQIRARSDAVASANATGPGGVEELTYGTVNAESFAVVLVNRAGSGEYYSGNRLLPLPLRRSGESVYRQRMQNRIRHRNGPPFLMGA